MVGRLDGARILILETREEAQFSRLLADQGASVLQCPMFTIEDAPDPAPIEAWIGRFIADPFDDLVLTTGEGLRRLIKVAQRLGHADALIGAIARSRTFARGPKPGRALREIGLSRTPRRRCRPRRVSFKCCRVTTSAAAGSGCSSIPKRITDP